MAHKTKRARGALPAQRSELLFDNVERVIAEPLISLAWAIAATVRQLQLSEVEVRVDRVNRTVVAEGPGMSNWGQHQGLEREIDLARLAYETHAT